MKYQVVSDGSMDLSPELAKEKNIEVVPFYVSFDSENYKIIISFPRSMNEYST